MVPAVPCRECVVGTRADGRYDDRQVPISLAMHLSDIYLEELDKVLGLPEVNSQVSLSKC